MSRETQLDTHEIDKLLADDDFIDDFNFDEEEDIDFIEEESGDDELAEPEPVDQAAAPEPQAAGSPAEPRAAAPPAPDSAAGLVASEDIMAEVAEDLDSLDLAGVFHRGKKHRWLKRLAMLALILLLLQLELVLGLLRQPTVIRSTTQALTAEIDLAAAPPSSPETETALPPDTPPANEPQVMVFTLFAPLYSLQGLKVVSLEVEVIQFPPFAALAPAGQKQLKTALDQCLRALTDGVMVEKIKDFPSLLEPPLRELIENFFAARELSFDQLEIRFIGTHVQE